MTLRRLNPDDAPAVTKLWHAGALDSASADAHFHPATSPEAYAQAVASDLRMGKVLGWAAVDATEGSVLAYLTAEIREPAPDFEQARYLYLLDLDVGREHRRKGFGAKLVAEARAFAVQEGLATIEVAWLVEDARASAFWARQGFAPYLARARAAVGRPASS